MVTFTVFPRLRQNPNEKSNPYIENFIASLNREGESTVINPPHRNPLLSILPPKRWGDVIIFNWFESIPDFKYGLLQAVTAICFVTILKLAKKKIVWVLHNKKPHNDGYTGMKKFLMRFIARKADLIRTHATEGLEIIRQRYPQASGKVHFLHHPTINRLPRQLPAENNILYDLLIWGTISRYKGIHEYISYLRNHPEQHPNVCIIGRCASASLLKELQAKAPDYVKIIPESPSFEKLSNYVACSRFVLIPYCPDSVLSSGVLMDSLSFGAKVIGPATGSFIDYSHNSLLNVHTFKSLDDIAVILSDHKKEKASLVGYRQFLDENAWQYFGNKIIELVTKTK